MRTTRSTTFTVVGATTALLLTGMLSACSQGSSSSSSESTGNTAATAAIPADGTDDGTTLTMWSRAPLERQAKNAVEVYNATHKNQVKLEIIPNDDMEGKVGAAVQTNALPDILAGDVVRIPYWASQGIFKDIDAQISSLDNLKDLQKGHIDAGIVDGKKHTLPFVTDISVMVWNKGLYREAGLDPEKGPKSMAEYVEHAKKIAALNKPGVSGTYLMGASGGGLVFTLFPMVWGDGDEVLAKDGKSSMLASGTALEVYKGMNELVKTPNGMGAGSKEETGATWTAPFVEGKVGLMPFPNTAVAGILESGKIDLGVSAIYGAKGKGPSTFLGGDALGISSSSKNAAQAWNFMKWLMSEDAQQKVFADKSDTASNLKVLENGYAKADERIKIMNATIKDGHSPVAINFNEAFNAAGSPWQLLIQDAVWGDGSQVKAQGEAIDKILAQ